MSTWQEQTYSYEWLERQALSSNHIGSMIQWLRILTVMPATVGWRRGARVVQTNLDPNRIPAGYLAELAYEWDMDMGDRFDYLTPHDTPRDFISALGFELKGSSKKAAVQSILDGLGRDRRGDEVHE